MSGHGSLPSDVEAPAGPDRLTQRAVEVAETVGNFIEWWGFKAIHGRIWLLLAIRHDPVPQTELADLLGVSRSLISMAMAELQGHGLVRPVSDHRNAPYRATMDVWPAIADVLREREWMILERVRLSLEALLTELEVEDSQVYEETRIRLLVRMTELAQVLLRMLIALRKPRAPSGVSRWVSRVSDLTRRLRAMT